MDSVSYLNNKFVVVLAFVVPSVIHSILLGGIALPRAIACRQYCTLWLGYSG